LLPPVWPDEQGFGGALTLTYLPVARVMTVV